VLQADLAADRVDEVVDPGHVLMVGAGEPGQAQGRPLHRHGRMPFGQVHDRPPGLAGEGPGVLHLGGVEFEDTLVA
jgi:hypothetical protein